MGFPRRNEKVEKLSVDILAVVDDAAQNPLTEHRATRKLEPGDFPTIALEPLEPKAAPLEIAFDTEHLITCFPGHCGMALEIFSKDPVEIVQGV